MSRFTDQKKGSSLERLKTNAGLLATLKKVAQQPITAEEMRQQRISFIAGNLPRTTTMSHDEIGEILDRHDGTRAA